MTKTIELDGITIELTQKKVKNLRLVIKPPDGRVRVSAPLRMSLKKITEFILSKTDWIKQHQQRMQEKSGTTAPLQYLDEEMHPLWGESYPLKISEHCKTPTVEIQNSYLHLNVRPQANHEKKQRVMDEFYRVQLHQALPALIEKWETIMDVKITGFSTQKMKSRWGVCKPKDKHIKLNTELAKKPIQCLEYVVVHELVHLLESSHNHRFKAFMDHFMPLWRQYRKDLKG